jgi:phage shock protein PspC (stress-responsive transcriptional regulator)
MKRLLKNNKDQMLFGVCSGLSDYTNIDVSIIRLFFVVGTFLTGTVLFWVYVLLAIILPSE